MPLQLIFSIGTDPNEQAVVQKAKLDLQAAIKTFDDQLEARTFLISESLSLTDLALFAVFLAARQLDLYDASSFPSVSRWVRMMTALPVVRAVLQDKERVKLVPPAARSLPPAMTTTMLQTKWDRHRIRVKELLASNDSLYGQTVTVKGWVRSTRAGEKGALLFVDLTDGSTVRPLQLVLRADSTVGFQAVTECGGVGASLAMTGVVQPSPAKGQTVEVHVTDASVLGAIYGGDKPGEIGGKNYPMAKKQHSLEFLREKAHLRPRSKLFSAAMRMRHAMAFATHQFFNDRGFVYVHTPLITAADCEGAGEQFVVTTLLPDEVKAKDIPIRPDGKVDYAKDFFSRRCCLTVSGQLNVETHACALSDVYTFGPTFRAENSHTARHLAEFWMIEPEICFADLVDDMALAEDYVKFCTAYALQHCADDLHYFEHEYPAGEKGLVARLRNVLGNDFARITYTDAVALLQSEVAAGKVQFFAYPEWGDDLGSEHERYLTEQIYQRPTIVINYPKAIKAFYMKVNDDDITVAAMDLLVPKIGELIGGSQR